MITPPPLPPLPGLTCTLVVKLMPPLSFFLNVMLGGFLFRRMPKPSNSCSINCEARGRGGAQRGDEGSGGGQGVQGKARVGYKLCVAFGCVWRGVGRNTGSDGGLRGTWQRQGG